MHPVSEALEIMARKVEKGHVRILAECGRDRIAAMVEPYQDLPEVAAVNRDLEALGSTVSRSRQLIDTAAGNLRRAALAIDATHDSVPLD